jgi:hypothetical protein
MQAVGLVRRMAVWGSACGMQYDDALAGRTRPEEESHQVADRGVCSEAACDADHHVQGDLRGVCGRGGGGGRGLGEEGEQHGAGRWREQGTPSESRSAVRRVVSESGPPASPTQTPMNARSH